MWGGQETFSQGWEVPATALQRCTHVTHPEYQGMVSDQQGARQGLHLAQPMAQNHVLPENGTTLAYPQPPQQLGEDNSLQTLPGHPV